MLKSQIQESWMWGKKSKKKDENLETVNDWWDGWLGAVFFSSF